MLVELIFINNQLWAGDDNGEWKQKIEKINDEFAQALVAGDVKRIYSFYTDDAVSMPNHWRMYSAF